METKYANILKNNIVASETRVSKLNRPKIISQQNSTHFKGWFISSQELSLIYPSCTPGDYAYVGELLHKSTVYRCVEENIWDNTNEAVSLPKVDLLPLTARLRTIEHTANENSANIIELKQELAKLPTPDSFSYSAVNGEININHDSAETIMYVLDNKTYIEDFKTSQTLSGVISLIRLFNCKLTDKQKTYLTEHYSFSELPSEWRNLKTLNYEGPWEGGYSSDVPRMITIKHTLHSVDPTKFPDQRGFRKIAIRYSDNTQSDIIPYSAFSSIDFEVTYNFTISATKPIKQIEVNFYNKDQVWSLGANHTTLIKDAGVLEEYNRYTIGNEDWGSTSKNTIDISTNSKIAYRKSFNFRKDMYLYGSDKECTVGQLTYKRVAYNGNEKDWSLVEENKRQKGSLHPISEILLGNKRYLGIHYGKHYACIDSTVELVTSTNGVDWTTLWVTNKQYGTIWHLSITPNNRIIVCTQAGGDNSGLYISDTNGLNFVKKISWTATAGSTVSTFQDIQVHNNIVLLNEYDSGAYGQRIGAKVWMSKDFGETFKVIFDGHKHYNVTSVNGSAGYNHIHGAFYDPYWDRVWICCGDRELSGLFWSDNYWDRPSEKDTFSDYKYCKFDASKGDTIDRANGVPQPIGGFAFPNSVIFGTDSYPNGFFATFRNSKENPAFERTEQIGEDKNQITVIPSRYHKSANDKPCYISVSSSVLPYNRIYATYNGVDFFVVWEDNCLNSDSSVNMILEKCYCWDDGEHVWISTRGYKDAGVRKLLKCRSLV